MENKKLQEFKKQYRRKQQQEQREREFKLLLLKYVVGAIAAAGALIIGLNILWRILATFA